MTAFDNIRESGSQPEHDGKIGKPYKAPTYVAYIRSLMREKHPDTVPRAWIVESIVRAYMAWFEDSLLSQNHVEMYGYGKISAECRVSRQTKRDQWYLKMYPSRHLLLRMREYKGTLTEAEKKEVAAKQAYAEKRRKRREVTKSTDVNKHSKNKEMQQGLAKILEDNGGALPEDFNLADFYSRFED